MPQGTQCPFVNLRLNFSNLEENQVLIADADQVYNKELYGVFNATSPYSFYNYPISQFMVSEYRFCLINEDSGIDPDHTDFILLTKERGCAQEGNFTTIDSMTEKDFFQNNPKLDILQDINGFPPPNLWEYKLGFTAVPSWDY